MKYCQCGVENSDNATFCAECGSRFQSGFTAQNPNNPNNPKDQILENMAQRINNRPYNTYTYTASTGGFWGRYFSFSTMVTDVLIKIVYVLGMVGISIVSIMILLSSDNNRHKYRDDPFAFTEIPLIAAILFFVFGNLLWRLLCEGWIVIFGIYKRIVSLDEKVGN